MSSKNDKVHSFTYLDDGEIVTAVRISSTQLAKRDERRVAQGLLEFKDGCNLTP